MTSSTFSPISTPPARLSAKGAFSLIEIVLALAVISFALVGIMGLFPAAMKSAKESQQETRATHIAQQIFDDLGSLPGNNTFIAIGTNITNSTSRQAVNLSAGGSYQVSYDLAGVPVGSGDIPGAIYTATIGITPNTPTTGVTRVQATVQTPSAAASGFRSSYVFVTLMNPGN